jgi:hypothetical protein
MCELIPVSIFPLFFLKRVVERWSLCDALTFDLVLLAEILFLASCGLLFGMV